MDALSQFNQRVLQCQDDAYSLAWYLLGDEAKAEATTQAAVKSTFQHLAATGEDCRLLILKYVVIRCRGRQPDAHRLAGPEILVNLHSLSEQERLALVLIDIFALSYNAVAWVIDCPVSEIIQLLAQARQKLSCISEVQYA